MEAGRPGYVAGMNRNGREMRPPLIFGFKGFGGIGVEGRALSLSLCASGAISAGGDSEIRFTFGRAVEGGKDLGLFRFSCHFWVCGRETLTRQGKQREKARAGGLGGQ
jgi:hypothetical protein